MHRWLSGFLLFWAACGGTSSPDGSAAHDPIIVSAAASTTEAVNAILADWNDSHDVQARATFASSSALARQIEAGAPVGIYISANAKWMDYLEEKELISPGSRSTLLTNQLVVIAPADTPDTNEDFLTQASQWSARLGDLRLSLGDPAHVPAGMYAKEALQNLGLWDTLEGKLAPGMDVRGALALVERGESPLGIVYKTDASLSQKIKVIETLPLDSHQPIAYPVAMVRDQENAYVQELLGHLSSTESKKTWTHFGFVVK
jgi:molybdate transport system substrate-binding protein